MSRAVLDSLAGRPFQSKGTKELLRAWILFNSFTIKPLVTSGKEVIYSAEVLYSEPVAVVSCCSLAYTASSIFSCFFLTEYIATSHK